MFFYLSFSIGNQLNYIGTSVASSGFLGRQTMPSSVCAFVGTPASMRRPSTLVWRQGPMHLIEEPLSSSRIAYIARLGPNYTGSFQSPPPVTREWLGSRRFHNCWSIFSYFTVHLWRPPVPSHGVQTIRACAHLPVYVYELAGRNLGKLLVGLFVCWAVGFLRAAHLFFWL